MMRPVSRLHPYQKLLVLSLLLLGLLSPSVPAQGVRGAIDQLSAAPALARVSGSTSPMVQLTAIATTTATPVLTVTPTVLPTTTPEPTATPASRLAFTKTAEPREVTPGDVITYTLALTNTGEEALEDPIVSDPLPEGVVYVPGSADGGVYDRRTGTITWNIPELAVGASLSLTFQGRVRGDVLDDFIVNVAEVRGRGLTNLLQAQATVSVVRQAVITPQGGVLETPSGRLRAEFPAGAVSQAVHARYTPRGRESDARFYVFDLEASQDTAEGPPVIRFNQPLTLILSYTQAEVEALAEDSLRLAYFDAALEEWIALDSQVDVESNRIVAWVDHFTTFAGEGLQATGLNGFTPEVVPSVLGAQVSQFTGDATYGLPLYVPPGPAGLRPDLTLRYSSRGVADNWLAAKLAGSSRHPHSQPGWVGQGWSLDFGYIMRDINGDPLGDAIDYSRHKYVLTMNGVAGNLVKSSDGYYYPETVPEWRLSWSGGDANGTWYAYAPDGTKYTFDQRMQFVNWTTNGSGCYDANIVALRWYLTQIEDTSSNQVRFTYAKEIRDTIYGGCTQHSYDTAVYPIKIEYGLNPSMEINFILGTRGDVGSWTDPAGDQNRFYRQKLNEIVIKAWDNAAEQLQVVRRYILDYDESGWGSPPVWLTLRKVRTQGRDGSELPPITFNYGQTWDAGNHSTRKLLTEINNGYDGKAVFTYEFYNPGWSYTCGGTDVNEGYRVQKREFYDGLGGVQRYSYTYSGQTGNCDQHQFLGHAQARQTVYADAWVTPISRVSTTFHQEESDNGWDPRLGRPKQVKVEEYRSGSWVERRRVENIWGWAQARAGVAAFQVALVESNTYYYPDGASTRQRTLHLSDQYGNRRAELSYGRYDGTTITVTNPGFVNMNGWGVSGVTAGVDEPPVYRSGRLVMNGESGVVYQDLTGAPNSDYELWTWVRGTGSAQFKMYAHNHTPCCDNRQDGTTIDPGTEWQFYKMVYRTDGSGQIRMHLNYIPGGSGDKVYVDNVTVAQADTTGDERTAFWWVYPNTADWIVNKVAQESVHSGIKMYDDSGSSLAAQTRYHYDATTGYPLSGTTPQGWDSQPLYGLLSQVDGWRTGTTYDVTGYRYDGFGNRTQVIDPRNNTTTTAYDTIFHAFPIQETNPLGHVVTTRYYGVNGSGATVAGAFFGQVESVTDPNGAETRYTYDDFGRVTKVMRPGDTITNPTVVYEYHDDDLEPPTPTMRTTRHKVEADAVFPDTGYTWVREFYDGLGRLIQVHTPYQDGEYDVVRFFRYDARGLKVAESAPYLKPAYTYNTNCNGKQCNPYVAPWLHMPQTQYRYDALGRLTQTVHPDGSAVSRVYSGWDTSEVDEKGAWRFSARDAFGRLIRVDETVDTFKDTFDDLAAWETNGDVYIESNDSP